MKMLRDGIVLFFLIVLGITINKMTSSKEASDQKEDLEESSEMVNTDSLTVDSTTSKQPVDSLNLKTKMMDTTGIWGQPKVNIVTLGVKDLKKSRAFYEETLAWTCSSASSETITFIQAGATVLALYPLAALQAETGKKGEDPTIGTTLAYNVGSEKEVDQIFDFLAQKNVRITKKPSKVFWGGYSGYFEDVDGYSWEVAFNPFFPLNKKGEIVLPL